MAEIVFYKLCLSYFSQGRAVEAVRLFRNYMHQYRDLPLETTGESSGLRKTVEECEKRAWAARQCINLASFLHRHKDILSDQQKTYEYLQNSTFVYMAISFERQRRVIVKNYTENNSDNPIGLEDPNVTINESEYIGGTPSIVGSKDKKAMEKMMYTYMLKKHLKQDGVLNMMEYLKKLKQSRIDSGQTSNVKKTMILQLLMCEEYVSVQEKGALEGSSIDNSCYETAYNLVHECMKSLKDGWKDFFRRSLHVALTCAEETKAMVRNM